MFTLYFMFTFIIASIPRESGSRLIFCSLLFFLPILMYCKNPVGLLSFLGSGGVLIKERGFSNDFCMTSLPPNCMLQCHAPFVNAFSPLNSLLLFDMEIKRNGDMRWNGASGVLSHVHHFSQYCFRGQGDCLREIQQ